MRSAGIVGIGGLAVALLAVAANQPWFQERCGAAGLSATSAAAGVVVVALVAGSIALRSRRVSGGKQRASDLRPCPSCDQNVLRSWRMCPYCGASLRDDVEKERACQRL